MAAQAEPVVAEKKSRSRNVTPPTFAEVAQRRMAERVEQYRSLAKRHAEGEPLTDSDLLEASDLLEGMALPDYAWTRDAEAMLRFATVDAKRRAAVEAEPANQQRSTELAREVEALQAKLVTLREELRRTQVAVNKSVTYAQTLAQLAVEHPHLFGPVDAAAEQRLAEVNRRRAAS
jgi:hypothetical protein